MPFINRAQKRELIKYIGKKLKFLPNKNNIAKKKKGQNQMTDSNLGEN